MSRGSPVWGIWALLPGGSVDINHARRVARCRPCFGLGRGHRLGELATLAGEGGGPQRWERLGDCEAPRHPGTRAPDAPGHPGIRGTQLPGHPGAQVFGLGHSLGAKLHVIRHSTGVEGARSEPLAVMAFNNFGLSDSLTLAKEALQAFQGGSVSPTVDAVWNMLQPLAQQAAKNAGMEFTPDPGEMEDMIRAGYAAKSTRIIGFGIDQLDCGADLSDAASETGSGPIVCRDLPGNHLTPVFFSVGDLAGEALGGAGAMGQRAAKAAQQQRFEVGDQQELDALLEELAAWLRPCTYTSYASRHLKDKDQAQSNDWREHDNHNTNHITKYKYIVLQEQEGDEDSDLEVALDEDADAVQEARKDVSYRFVEDVVDSEVAATPRGPADAGTGAPCGAGPSQRAKDDYDLMSESDGDDDEERGSPVRDAGWAAADLRPGLASAPQRRRPLPREAAGAMFGGGAAPGVGGAGGGGALAGPAGGLLGVGGGGVAGGFAALPPGAGAVLPPPPPPRGKAAGGGAGGRRAAKAARPWAAWASRRPRAAAGRRLPPAPLLAEDVAAAEVPPRLLQPLVPPPLEEARLERAAQEVWCLGFLASASSAGRPLPLEAERAQRVPRSRLPRSRAARLWAVAAWPHGPQEALGCWAWLEATLAVRSSGGGELRGLPVFPRTAAHSACQRWLLLEAAAEDLLAPGSTPPLAPYALQQLQLAPGARLELVMYDAWGQPSGTAEICVTGVGARAAAGSSGDDGADGAPRTEEQLKKVAQRLELVDFRGVGLASQGELALAVAACSGLGQRSLAAGLLFIGQGSRPRGSGARGWRAARRAAAAAASAEARPPSPARASPSPRRARAAAAARGLSPGLRRRPGPRLGPRARGPPRRVMFADPVAERSPVRQGPAGGAAKGGQLATAGLRQVERPAARRGRVARQEPWQGQGRAPQRGQESTCMLEELERGYRSDTSRGSWGSEITSNSTGVLPMNRGAIPCHFPRGAVVVT
ncbi:unnamed protein product [Prorocentrum cordatum]|uniref:Uncharacterized protein n=1 Tax=Prorocentrum cordatum TaxID=2364126 RepID=A0ABN9SKN5_9DINO|nr:unnamed protein product [Polarella glacialis]